jgi:hypothetical protein
MNPKIDNPRDGEKPIRKPKPFRDLSGRRFGRLTIINRADDPRRAIRWNALCDCGKKPVVIGAHLLNGNSQSCGCLRAERVSAAVMSHGHTVGRRHSPEYSCFIAMKNRCNRANHVHYERYGGAGIRVCDEWNGPGGFEHFLAHIGPMPMPRMSIDRINGLQGYFPENVKWSSRAEQARNLTTNAWLEGLGKRRILKDWAAEFGIHPSALKKMIVGIATDFGLFVAAMVCRPDLVGMISEEEMRRDQAVTLPVEAI